MFGQCARLSPRDNKRCCSGEVAAYCIRAATNACKPHKSKMEFNMLASAKQVSIAIAVTLGVALSMPLSVPAFSDSAPPSKTAMQKQAAPPIRNGDLVRVRSGGPLMTVTGVEGDQVNCSWTDWDGQLKSESFPIAVLGVPITVPPQDPSLEQDERASDQYYQKHCPPGTLSILGKFVCAF
jgi:uncharacterized protein YodC (DUF2158 family)